MNRIRLARKGRRNLPFFHIVVTNQRTKRDGGFLEKIGDYNPIAKTNNMSEKCNINRERFQYWISVGAQPSDKVKKLFSILK